MFFKLVYYYKYDGRRRALAGFGKFFSVFKSFGIYLTKLENLKGFFSRLILTFVAFYDKILYKAK